MVCADECSDRERHRRTETSGLPVAPLLADPERYMSRKIESLELEMTKHGPVDPASEPSLDPAGSTPGPASAMVNSNMPGPDWVHDAKITTI